MIKYAAKLNNSGGFKDEEGRRGKQGRRTKMQGDVSGQQDMQFSSNKVDPFYPRFKQWHLTHTGDRCEDGYVRFCGIFSTVIAGHLAVALTAVALIGLVCHPAALRWLIVGLASLKNAR